MIRAIIFDLDGTLADTEPLHFEAFAAALVPHGILLKRDDYFRRLIGYSDRECFDLVLRENGIAEPDRLVQALIAKKAQSYQRIIAERDVLLPGAAEFARRSAARMPVAIATGTLREEAEMILGRAGLRELFAGIVAAEDVERGKPEPHPFTAAFELLRAARAFNPPLAAVHCLVVEDTVAGIEAAHRAGMKVLALCHTARAEELRAAELVRSSLAETNLDEVLRALCD